MKSTPSGWATCRLEDLACSITYGYTAKSSSTEGNARLLRITDIQDGLVMWHQVPFCQISAADAESYFLRNNDLVFARTGATVGKSHLVRDVPENAVFASYLIRVRPKETQSAKYLAYFFGSHHYWKQITDFSAGIGQPNVNGSKLKSLLVLVAPAKEQKRIAGKLDTVLARVDATNTRLARVAPILKRFRQSVLASATSGRLTQDWRNDSHSDAGDIPLNWKKTTLRHCVTSMTGGASPSVENYAPAGVLALNKGDIKLYGMLAGKKDQKRVPREFAEQHRTKLVQQGDLLVTLRDLSSKADFLGLIAQFMGTEIALPTQGMYALTVGENTVPKFLMYFSNSPIYREVMKREKVGATQVHLRNDQFLDIPIALPPVKEQAEIVLRVETLFAFADRLEARLQTAHTAAERLTPALLAKAFRGELVPQDPNDEPASELLKRLAAAALSPAPKRGHKKAADAAA